MVRVMITERTDERMPIGEEVVDCYDFIIRALATGEDIQWPDEDQE